MARGVCKLFDWQRPNGEPPIRSCTALLTRLERMGVLRLPTVRRRAPRRSSGLPGLAGKLVIVPEPLAQAAVDRSAPLLVRPIAEAERLGWQAYMERFHYLGDCRLVGESLRYVATLGDELVALLGWASASLNNEPRDRHVGWDREAKSRALHQVVNNVRFLVLPWVQQPNLASRVLGANLRRLSADWQAVYGHRVLLAETFVDTSRFAGTCYRASNWRYLGETQGFSKRGSRYWFHGQSKAVFVYPLDRRSSALLCAPPPSATSAPGHEDKHVRTLALEKLPVDGEGGLFAVLGTITDPRMRRGMRHPLQSVLAVSVCATLAGARGFTAVFEWAADQSGDFLKKLRCRRGRPPSERTIRRVLKAVDVQEVDTKIGQWLASQQDLAGQCLAVDGKTLCGSRDGEDERAVHLLSAVVHGTGEVVAQTRVDGKTNEITRVEPLLSDLDIQGAVVTGDALLTQREIARHIVEDKHADYVFQVKDNQPTLRQDIADFFAAEQADKTRQQAARRSPGEPPPDSEAFPP
ncbi:MAG TPA: ISAs1 family transposase [Polyangia bacterium]|nr:ISAs1 family transposase [Polyangia bacterium]